MLGFSVLAMSGHFTSRQQVASQTKHPELNTGWHWAQKLCLLVPDGTSIIPVSYQYHTSIKVLVSYESWVHVTSVLESVCYYTPLVKRRPASNEHLNIPACWKWNRCEFKVDWNSRCCTKRQSGSSLQFFLNAILRRLFSPKTTKFWLGHHMYITTYNNTCLQEGSSLSETLNVRHVVFAGFNQWR